MVTNAITTVFTRVRDVHPGSRAMENLGIALCRRDKNDKIGFIRNIAERITRFVLGLFECIPFFNYPIAAFDRRFIFKDRKVEIKNPTPPKTPPATATTQTKTATIDSAPKEKESETPPAIAVKSLEPTLNLAPTVIDIASVIKADPSEQPEIPSESKKQINCNKALFKIVGFASLSLATVGLIYWLRGSSSIQNETSVIHTQNTNPELATTQFINPLLNVCTDAMTIIETGNSFFPATAPATMTSSYHSTYVLARNTMNSIGLLWSSQSNPVKALIVASASLVAGLGSLFAFNKCKSKETTKEKESELPDDGAKSGPLPLLNVDSESPSHSRKPSMSHADEAEVKLDQQPHRSPSHAAEPEQQGQPNLESTSPSHSRTPSAEAQVEAEAQAQADAVDSSEGADIVEEDHESGAHVEPSESQSADHSESVFDHSAAMAAPSSPRLSVRSDSQYTLGAFGSRSGLPSSVTTVVESDSRPLSVRTVEQLPTDFDQDRDAPADMSENKDAVIEPTTHKKGSDSLNTTLNKAEHARVQQEILSAQLEVLAYENKTRALYKDYKAATGNNALALLKECADRGHPLAVTEYPEQKFKQAKIKFDANRYIASNKCIQEVMRFTDWAESKLNRPKLLALKTKLKAKTSSTKTADKTESKEHKSKPKKHKKAA